MEKNIEVINCRGKREKGLIGKQFQDRYILKKVIDSKKKIYLVNDKKDNNRDYWLKLDDPFEIAHEINVMCDLKNNDNKDVKWMPNIVSFGFLALKNYKKISENEQGEDNCPSFGYCIMTAYQFSLQTFLEQNHKEFQGKDLATLTLTIAEQLLNMLQKIHKTGYVYNDLHPSNIVILYDQNKDIQINLINFSKASKFVTKNSLNQYVHIDDIEKTQDFNGNLEFCTLNQLNNYRTSRCDDINSLLYVIIYMLNDRKFVGKRKYTRNAAKSIQDAKNYRLRYDEIALVENMKYQTEMEVLQTKRANCTVFQILIMLAKVCHGYSFFDAPDYQQLTEILTGKIVEGHQELKTEQNIEKMVKIKIQQLF